MAVTPGTYSISGDIHEAVTIDPFNLTNLFVNCAFPGSSRFSRSRIHLAINNLIDSHAITAVSLATKGSTATSPDDVLTLMSGRSVSVALTIGYTGARP
jgi:hypothetical protein